MKDTLLYKAPYFTKSRFNIAGNWWSKEPVLIVLIVAFTGLDASTLYEIFQEVCTESPLTSLILTFGAALALNFLPLLLVRLYKEHSPVWMIIAILVVFCLLFSALFYLRWQTAADVFAAGSGGMTTMNAKESTSQNDGQTAVTLLLGILPLITSVINAMLSYFQDTTKNELKQLEVQRSKAKQHLDVVKAAICELKSVDWSTHLKAYDEEQYEQAIESIKATTEMIKTYARIELAKKLKTPEAISALLEPNKENIEGGITNEE